METTMSSIGENYMRYLKEESLKIGFTEEFPVVEKITSRQYAGRVRDTEVVFWVRYCRFSFGDGRYTVQGIVTDPVRVKDNRGLGGFGHHGYIEEAQVMREGVIEMCKSQNLMICNEICSWPFAKVIVQPNHYKD